MFLWLKIKTGRTKEEEEEEEHKRGRKRGKKKEVFINMNDFRSSECKYFPQNRNVFEVEEILSNILVKLSVKCLLICKSVCKYWRSLVCSSSFMSLHFIKSREYNNPSDFIVHDYHWGNIHIRHEQDLRIDVFRYYHTEKIHLMTKIDEKTTQIFPSGIGFYFGGMICSFNGLVCCINRDITSTRSCNCGQKKVYDLYKRYFSINIINPATQEVLLLPQAPASECPNHNYQSTLGVSFHSAINEYKVFQFFSREKRPYECMVYSSITGSWKSIATSVAHCPLDFAKTKHVCINGTVYWFWKSRLDGGSVGYILAVDWEENFSIIRIPHEETMKGVLVDLEGCLSIVVVTKNGGFQCRFDIWVLEDSKESIWVKKLSDCISFSTSDLVRHIAVGQNEILFGTRKQYSLYNIHTRSRRVFNWARGPYWFAPLPVAFAESLFPCKYPNINSIYSILYLFSSFFFFFFGKNPLL